MKNYFSLTKTIVRAYRATSTLALGFVVGKFVLSTVRERKRVKPEDQAKTQNPKEFCEHCHKNRARVRVDQYTNIHRETHYLCQDCADALVNAKQDLP